MNTRANSEAIKTGTAASLRRELSARNLTLAAAHAHDTTYGELQSVIYHPAQDTHGNFFPASYRRICGKPEWARRLNKTYTASGRIARGHERERAELDCANSSDALLMNIFCHPTAPKALRSLLNIDTEEAPQFGVRANTPLAHGLLDRTEIDMQWGDLLVEAKLTETGFGTARPALMARYPSFEDVFDVEDLPTVRGDFASYQLLRGILAAYHSNTRFALFCDARRPDLFERWFRTLAAVSTSALRSRLTLYTWQEIAQHVPRPLQQFLAIKYGIARDPLANAVNAVF